IDGLATALRAVRDALRGGAITAGSCRHAVDSFAYDRIADGLMHAGSRLRVRKTTPLWRQPGHPRVLALFGNMVSVFGLERMSFEVLRTLREGGAAVHCVVNRWESSRVVDLADALGASWSTGYYWYELRRRATVRAQLLGVWDVFRTSMDLFRDARRFRVTHVFA